MDKIYQVELSPHQLRRLEESSVKIDAELDPKVPDLLEDILEELKTLNAHLGVKE